MTGQSGTDSDMVVSVFDGRSGALLAAVPIGPYGEYYDNPFGTGGQRQDEHGLRVDPLDGHVYTIDGATNAIVHAAVVGGEPAGLAVNTATNTVFVTGAHTVAVINGRSGRVTNRIAGGQSTRGIAVDTARNKIFTRRRAAAGSS